jgi:uncharacterized protein
MIRAIDFMVNSFIPEAVQRNFVRGEERERLESVGRTADLQGYSPAEFMSILGGLGVEKILVPSIITWSYRDQRPIEYTSVEEVIEIQDAVPGKVFGLYGVNPRRGMEAVSEFAEAVTNHGFRGLHIHPHGFGIPPDHAFYFPFYAKCQELGVTAVVSMGHTLDFMPMEMGRPVHLDSVALYFPELKIVCGHTGWPWVEEAIALVSKHPHVFLGTSAYAPRYWRPEMVQYLNSRRGRDKVLWGTDWPLVRHAEALEQIEALHLASESKDRLLYLNAARVFEL